MTYHTYSVLCPLWLAMASCSLLFSSADEDKLSPDASAALFDADLSGPQQLQELPFEEDFEAPELAPSIWGRAFDSGDRCTIGEPGSGTSEGSRALHCTTDNTSGSEASVYVDFAETNSVIVEMDIRFETAPVGFISFLQTIHAEDEGSIHRLTSSSAYGSRQVDVYNFEESASSYATGFQYADDVWYHVTFESEISELDGYVTLDIDGTHQASLSATNTGSRGINRLAIGISLTMVLNKQSGVFIDNFVIKERL